jgi:hypothetical protein
MKLLKTALVLMIFITTGNVFADVIPFFGKRQSHVSPAVIYVRNVPEGASMMYAYHDGGLEHPKKVSEAMMSVTVLRKGTLYLVHEVKGLIGQIHLDDDAFRKSRYAPMPPLTMCCEPAASDDVHSLKCVEMPDDDNSQNLCQGIK